MGCASSTQPQHPDGAFDGPAVIAEQHATTDDSGGDLETLETISTESVPFADSRGSPEAATPPLAQPRRKQLRAIPSPTRPDVDFDLVEAMPSPAGALTRFVHRGTTVARVDGVAHVDVAAQFFGKPCENCVPLPRRSDVAGGFNDEPDRAAPGSAPVSPSPSVGERQSLRRSPAALRTADDSGDDDVGMASNLAEASIEAVPVAALPPLQRPTALADDALRRSTSRTSTEAVAMEHPTPVATVSHTKQGTSGRMDTAAAS
jgi:hypothetical protein